MRISSENERKQKDIYMIVQFWATSWHMDTEFFYCNIQVSCKLGLGTPFSGLKSTYFNKNTCLKNGRKTKIFTTHVQLGTNS